MDHDEELNPNPNSTLSPPNTVTKIQSSLPPIASIPTPAIPPIALIPRPLAIRHIKGEIVIKDESDDDSDPGEVSEESMFFREKLEKAMQDILIKKSAAVALAVLKNNKVVRSGLRKLGKLEMFMRFLEEEEGVDGGEDGAKARLDKERSKRDDPDQDLHNFYSKLENVKSCKKRNRRAYTAAI
ncbi:hypothetical protein Tco_1276950 [Tanacetum coccineum]